ncbi:MAG: PQQ-binding-like beta-propeller repeat protein [Aureliella sp.]
METSDAEQGLASGTQPVAEVGLRALRIGMPIALLALMIFARFVPQLWDDGPAMTWALGSFGPLLAGFVLLVVWWLCFSRASWKERVWGFLGVVASVVVVSSMLHETLRGLIPVITLPLALFGFGAGMVLTSQWRTRWRTCVGVACGFVLACSTALMRNEGAWGSFAFDLHYRFSPTSEEEFLSEIAGRQATAAVELSDSDVAALEQAAQWPGFRGPDRMGVQRGLRFATDWNANPPDEIWRIKVGPAWSSFAAAGNLLYTQEQRGEEEVVVCYSADSGKEIWASGVESRFFEALGGLGPRATPTLHDSAVYSMGAAGVLLKLDAATGQKAWEVDFQEVAQRGPPMWGFSSSPLVVDDMVVVYAGGKEDLGVLAFSADTGELRWTAPAGPMSYGSLQKINPLGQAMLGLLSDVGLQTYDAATGKPLFEYSWPHTGYRALQPLFVDQERVLIPTGMGAGTRLVNLQDSGGELTGEEVWTSRRLKPDYSDIFVHKGNVYGFDNSVFASISLDDGKLNWKGGRYGKGQAILLADSDTILVVTEEGELVLVETNPEEHVELGRLESLDGRTWNHPIVVGDKLFVRNAAEAVCYRLATEPVANSAAPSDE